jgi:hypothetical protein
LYLGWSSQNGADLENLIDLAGTGEEWPEGVDLGHDAANCPQVYRGVVDSRTKKYLRSSVPEIEQDDNTKSLGLLSIIISRPNGMPSNRVLVSTLASMQSAFLYMPPYRIIFMYWALLCKA